MPVYYPAHSGYSGHSGYGTSGYSGYSGYSGLSGYSGYSGSGVSGYSGYSGAGTSGYSGYSGLSGYSGYSGSGVSGYSGYSGAGTSGYSGYSGLSGYSGSPNTLLSEIATQLVTASTTIVVTDGSPVTPFTVAAGGGNVTSTAVPLIASGRDGQLIVLRNDSGNDTDSLTLSDTNYLTGSNIRLDADTLVMQGNSVMGLIYSTTNAAWIKQWYLKLKHYTGTINSFTINIGSGTANAQNSEVAGSGTFAPTFAWTFTGIPSSGTVNSSGGEAGYPATISAPYTSLVGPNINKGTSIGLVRTFTPSIIINGATCTSPTATITYINRRYAGTTTATTQPIDATVNGFSIAVLDASQYANPWPSITAGASEYIWVSLRSALTDPFFSIGGVRAGFSPNDDNLPAYVAQSHTNASSFSENYDYWRSYATNLGTVTTLATLSSAAANHRYFIATTSTGLLSDGTINAGTTDTNTALPVSQTVNAIGSNYAYFVYPSRLTTAAYISANGYIAGTVDEGTQSHRNIYGYLETYRQFRTNTVGLGNVSYTFTTVLPVNKTYGGPNVKNTALSSAQVIALDDNASTGSYNTTGAKYSSVSIKTTTAGQEYAWYCYRSTYGNTTMYFGIYAGIGQNPTALERAGFTEVGTGTVSVTNEQGYAETFRQWCSNIPNPTGRGGQADTQRTVTVQSTVFNNRVYMGPCTNGTSTITTSQILSLDDTASGTSILNSAVAGSYPVSITTGNYLWFCHPASIPDLATIKDNSTGFGVDGAYQTNISHTNDSGYTETYRCWRSTNSNIFPSGGTVVVT